ncbi:MAG: hypothetical protein JKY80_00650, partial [Mariprofundaceae bacterium]|nr:hypothetical protein [Mariprofundaceae bacterium]
CLLLFEIILSLHSMVDGKARINITHSDFIESNSMLPPDFTLQASSPRTLPDNWLRSHSGMGGSSWYRSEFELKQTNSTLWAVFIPRVNMNVAVFLNDKEIGNSGSFLEPMARNWARPLYYTIPTELLDIGKNTLKIHLKSYPGEGGGLSKILVGENEDLLPLFQKRFFLQVDVAQITFFLNMIAGLIAFTLWRLRHKDTLYAYFSLICFSSSFFILNHFIQYIPVSRDTWHFAVHISIGWFAFSLLAFTQYFIAQKTNKWLIWLLAYMTISSIVLFAMKNITFMFLWHIGSLTMVSYACIQLLKVWMQKKRGGSPCFIFCAFRNLDTWVP